MLVGLHQICGKFVTETMLVVCLKLGTEFYLAMGKARYLNEVSLVNLLAKAVFDELDLQA